ncbi:MAG: hypothetical protein A7315_00300 [Candidatus Altiarchaeales archaeon WOR_SM1_79]|nr:MAG: hypothetical protein A7315_00300 [Candidatus Altiarchaeales archaeon WOR_SM1_79]
MIRDLGVMRVIADFTLGRGENTAGDNSFNISTSAQHWTITLIALYSLVFGAAINFSANSFW